MTSQTEPSPRPGAGSHAAAAASGATSAAVSGSVPPAPPTDLLKAGLWMAGTIASFVLMTLAGREVQSELTPFQLMFWRSLFGFTVIFLIVTLRGPGLKGIRPTNHALHFQRNLFHFAGQNLWFYGISVVPLAQLIAIEFTSPIWVMLLAPLVLGEKLTSRKLLAALVGFIGVLIVAQPGVQPLGFGHLAGALSAIGFAMSLLLTRKIMIADKVLVVLFWMTLTQTLLGLVTSFIGGFTLPSQGLIPWIIVLGATGLSAHYCLTSALHHAPATVVAPMEFIRLPIVALVGSLVYAEALDPWVFIGALVIFAANWSNMRSSSPTR